MAALFGMLATALWAAVSWIFRAVVIKFVLFTALFLLLAFLAPKLVELITPWISTSSLSSAFGGLGSGVWFFLDFFQLSFGVPLLLSAYVTRFLIRRIPVIG
jgi:hypothetical protein